MINFLDLFLNMLTFICKTLNRRKQYHLVYCIKGQRIWFSLTHSLIYVANKNARCISFFYESHFLWKEWNIRILFYFQRSKTKSVHISKMILKLWCYYFNCRLIYTLTETNNLRNCACIRTRHIFPQFDQDFN